MPDRKIYFLDSIHRKAQSKQRKRGEKQKEFSHLFLSSLISALTLLTPCLCGE